MSRAGSLGTGPADYNRSRLVSEFSWDDCPVDVRAQVTRLVVALQALLGANLLGVYLHCSLAMGCFNPEQSDIDLLVVVRDSMPGEIKRRVAALLLHVSGAP